MRNIFEREYLQSSSLVYRWRTKTRIRRDGPSTAWSKVKVAKSRGAPDRCLPISLERKVPEASKLVSRLWMPRAIMRTSFKAKRSKVKLDYNLLLRLKVYHINRKLGRLRNFKTGRLHRSNMRYINCHGQLKCL